VCEHRASVVDTLDSPGLPGYLDCDPPGPSGRLAVDWYEDEVRMLEREREADPGPADPVAFYGSSSIRLWDDIAADLGDPRIVNLGFGGSTLAACAHYFGRVVVPYRPRSVVVYAGDNDLGDGRTPGQVHASFVDLLGQLDARLGAIPFAFLAIKPSPARWALTDSIRSANAMIKGDLAARPNSDYIDVFGPMLGPRGRPRPEFYAGDGLHLSPEGYRLWAREILAHRHTLF